MSEIKKSKVELEDRVVELEKAVNDINAWRRKASTNWKNFCSKFVGTSAFDGKLTDTRDGYVARSGLVAMAVSSLLMLVVVGIAAIDLGSDQTDLQNYEKFRIDKNGSTSIASNLTVWGQAFLYGKTVISNGTIATTDVIIANSLTAGGPVTFAGAQTNASTMRINGALDLNASADISGNLVVASNVTAGTVSSMGATVLGGAVTASNTVTVVGHLAGTTEYLSGAAQFGSSVTASGVVAAVSHATVGGNLTVTGAQTNLAAMTAVSFIATPGATVTQAIAGVLTNVYNSSGFLISHNP